MKRLVGVGVGGLVAAGLLLMAPLLMVMVVMGGSQQSLTGGCTGSVALAAGSSDGSMSTTQRTNAGTVIAVGRGLDVPDRGILIALAAAHQESGFRNYANDGLGDDLAPDQVGIDVSIFMAHDAVGSDHGSLGIFQQQWPWWGTIPELMDPSTASRLFYQRLLRVPGWEHKAIGAAAQAVQHSAHPVAYDDDVPLAQQLLADPSLEDSASNAASLTQTASCVSRYAGDVVYPLPAAAHAIDQHNFGDIGSAWAHGHTGTDFSAPCGTPALAATTGTVIVRTDQPWAGTWLVEVSTGPASLTTWYAHMQAVTVSDGQTVQAGQQIGEVGDLGNATGCHLHFEVHPTGGSIYEDDVDPSAWLAQHVGSSTVDVLEPEQGPAPTATILTANVLGTLTERQAEEQIRYLLSARPDVLLLQEVNKRDIAAIVARAPGNWSAYQPTGVGQRGSAIVWNASRFSASQHGVELGYYGHRYSRWMPWVILEGDDGTLPVVGMHMPVGTHKSDLARDQYKRMTHRYLQLIGALTTAGYPPVVGADWNRSLDSPTPSWGPAPQLAAIGYTTNWRGGTPCRRTSIHGGRIDGFAFSPAAMQITNQGCLDRGYSDHRPVWIQIAPTGGSPYDG
jgi:murein DD-endopeptidase MepM/ murein hydrolase activator NlpD/exonuclease III